MVGNIDLVYGMQWRVELTLRPGRAVLEQATTLYNRSDLRHRFYWWTNAAVEAWDDSKLVYPMAFTASHGFTQVDTWPVNADRRRPEPPGQPSVGAGLPLQPREPRALHGRLPSADARRRRPLGGSRGAAGEEGMELGGRRRRPRLAQGLSDNDSAEVEIQAGLFRNQETYGFLEPQETVRFRESWLPVRRDRRLRPGDTRCRPERRARQGGGRTTLVVGLNVTRPVTRGRLRVLDGTRVLADEALSLIPSGVLRKSYAGLAGRATYTVEALGDEGKPARRHTEGVYDQVPAAEVQVGRPAGARVPSPGARSEGDFVALGDAQEREGKLLRAMATRTTTGLRASRRASA